MSVLVDTSIWIEYFRNGNCSDTLEFLIDENIIVTNELILCELIPFLKLRKQKKLISLLTTITTKHIDIIWNQIIEYQYKCLINGINGVGIPDLIIGQNAKQNGCSIYSVDNHFNMIKNVIGFELYGP